MACLEQKKTAPKMISTYKVGDRTEPLKKSQHFSAETVNAGLSCHKDEYT